MREGQDLTIVSTSYMTLEAMRAAEILAKDGLEAEVLDVRTPSPLDDATILDSVRRTGRLLVADTGWKSVGFGAEIVARIAEEAFSSLKAPPRRVALPDCPTPTTPALADHYYPRAINIVHTAKSMLGLNGEEPLLRPSTTLLDVPDMSLTGPF